jgi:carbohydrate-binding DOMON domain-containing protein
MCFVIFSTTFVWNISDSKKNWRRYDKKYVLVFMYSTRYSCPILMKLEFSQQIFEKYLNVKFHENPFSGKRVFHEDGRTDEQTWQS